MSPRQKHSTILPVLGLNTSAPGEYIDPREAPTCQNIEINRSVIQKRLGGNALGTSLGERVMAGRELQIGSLGFTLRVGLTATELLDKITNTWSSVNHAVWTGTAADRFDFAFPILSGEKIMTITNGIDAIRKYTGVGNTAALGGSPPLAKYQVAYKTYLMLANITTGGNDFPWRVQWSDTGDPENWSTGNAGSQELIEDGLDITGLGLFGDYVTVHKESAIYVGYLVATSAVFRFDRKNTGVGAVSHDTIRSLPTGEQIFLARDGIHIFNGITAPLIPSPIMDEIRESLNPANAYKACSVVLREKDEYWCAMPIGSQTDPETVYKYNYRTGRVWKDVRPNLTAMWVYEKTDQTTWDQEVGTWDSDTTRWDDVIYLDLNPVVLTGDSSGNVIRREAVYNDNGTAIDARWESKDYTAQDLGDNELGRIVDWTAIQVWAKGNTVDLEYSINGGDTWTAIGTITLDSDYPGDDAPDYGWFDVASSRIRFRFSNDTAGETFTLKQFVVEGQLREGRR